jgi:hypothetical protein
VRTRTLLLLAIACGVVILTAGVVQLLRVATEDDARTETAALGVAVDIGDLEVTVDDVAEAAGYVDVTITVGGVDDADGTDRFRLVVASPPALEPVDGGSVSPPTCAATTVEPQQCRLRFQLPAEPGTSRVLNFRRGDEAVNWVLRTD